MQFGGFAGHCVMQSIQHDRCPIRNHGSAAPHPHPPPFPKTEQRENAILSREFNVTQASYWLLSNRKRSPSLGTSIM